MAAPARTEPRKSPRSRFRLLEKKRGRRRTGPKWIGRAGEMLFFAALFLIGLFSLSALIISYLAALRHEAPDVGWGTWLLLAIFGTLVITGAGGILYTVLQAGTSAERRSVLARRASMLEPSMDARELAKKFPTIPSDANLTDSPGVKLRYRLPMQNPPGLRLLIVAVFALAWNGVVAGASVWLINLYRAGRTDVFSAAVVILFAPVGVLAIYYLFRLLAVAAAVGPTGIEISDHPLYPGQTYRLYAIQMGHLTLSALQISLVCDEEVTYRQGTDTRVEMRRVLEQPVFHRADLAIRPGRPFEWEGELLLPQRVIHSFRADHNAIQWRLVVMGQPQRWARFERCFPVVLYPAVSDNAQGSG